MNGVDTFRSLWEFLVLDLLPAFFNFWERVYGILSMSVYDVVTLGGLNPLGVLIFAVLPEGSKDMPILIFLLGTGLIVFFAVTVVKWLLDLIN